MVSNYKYDVFISHAFEDKENIADPLNIALRQAGFKVWYSGTDLKAGDDLEHRIPEAISQSKYGIVILSKDYLKSKWGEKELAQLALLEKTTKRKIILPIWHNVSVNEIKYTFPFHINRFALHSKSGMALIQLKLIAELKKEEPQLLPVKENSKKRKNKSEDRINNTGIFIKSEQIQMQGNSIAGRDFAGSKSSNWHIRIIVGGIITLVLSLCGFYIQKHMDKRNLPILPTGNQIEATK